MDHAAQLRAYAEFVDDDLTARGLRAAADELDRLKAEVIQLRDRAQDAESRIPD